MRSGPEKSIVLRLKSLIDTHTGSFCLCHKILCINDLCIKYLRFHFCESVTMRWYSLLWHIPCAMNHEQNAGALEFAR